VVPAGAMFRRARSLFRTETRSSGLSRHPWRPQSARRATTITGSSHTSRPSPLSLSMRRRVRRKRTSYWFVGSWTVYYRALVESRSSTSRRTRCILTRLTGMPIDIAHRWASTPAL
jgi:hypothetical protein